MTVSLASSSRVSSSINYMANVRTSRGYKKLNVDYILSPELTNAIDNFMYHINYESGMSEDCYRSEIEFWLKDSYDRLLPDQYEEIKRYYVLGYIYAGKGYPWKTDSVEEGVN